MKAVLFVLALVAMPAALHAQDWAVMAAQKKADVVKGQLRITPASDWNRSSSRPSDRGETWTRDGVSLNELTFYAGIQAGESIYRQGYAIEKKLPKFKADMLPTDLVEMFEASNRILLQSSVFKVEVTEPAKFGGHSAVRFRYNYAVQEEDLPRRGEAVALIKDKKLYLVNFVAPSLYFFDRDILEVRKMIETAVIDPMPVASSASKTDE
jgi:hypothetical protein